MRGEFKIKWNGANREGNSDRHRSCLQRKHEPQLMTS